MSVRRWSAAAALVVGLVACAGPSGPGAAPSPPATTPPEVSTTTAPTPPDDPTPPKGPATAPTATPTPTPTAAATAAPDWLGSRVLAEGPTGYPPPQDTPPQLFPRRIRTEDVLPPPAGDEFTSSIAPVGEDVAARSTWKPECPVGLDELRHVTVTFWGFDEQHHTGELLVHRDVADDVVAVFGRLHEERFPVEAVTITTQEGLDAPPTGDGNATTAFVCRPTTGSGSWSAHAYGLAIDVNPFQNPYVREVDAGRIVLPELATAYTDRSLDLPGMIHEDGPVVAAFRDVGWTWGGDFQSLFDPHHFSATGR